MTVRTLIVVAYVRRWRISQMNVKNVFLNDDLYEEVYMTPPPDISHQSDIAYAVHMVSQFVVAPTTAHWVAVLRILSENLHVFFVDGGSCATVLWQQAFRQGARLRLVRKPRKVVLSLDLLRKPRKVYTVRGGEDSAPNFSSALVSGSGGEGENLIGDEEEPLIQSVDCRICQEEDHVENLEVPCACNGSLKYAHRACIQRWCNEKGDTTCEICHENTFEMVALILGISLMH
ncbi:uncharacterized protein LOC122042384 [Zingiber officinale]|uniref:uncharacterized protein LOC122042384 n=1 Tax=Zingiber officinale TaxID=94328 RepID=UPI001C4AA071|nr:uncharacterized protein LOC122042384 [Zingiber officinale]